MKKKSHLEYCEYSKTIRQMPENYLIAHQLNSGAIKQIRPMTPYWVCIPDLAANIDLATKVFQALFDFDTKYGSAQNLLQKVKEMEVNNES